LIYIIIIYNIIRKIILDTHHFLVNFILSKNKDLYYEIKFAYLTGLRWNEQFSLLRSDFERTNFGPQIGFTGKGGKYRIVPLCDEALEIIEILLQIPSVKSDYIFYNSDTGH
jgi:integrase